MQLPPEHTTTLVAPRGDLTLRIEDHGEHHMGCRSIWFVPSRPLGGVRRFRTTNGMAFFTPDGSGLVLHDVNVLLFVTVATGEVHHLAATFRRGFREVGIVGDRLVYVIIDAIDEVLAPVSIPLAAVPTTLRPGFGKVRDGDFPSAYP